ncbi:MATE family efflux transporter, partial [Prevotella koreensis]
MKPTQKIIFNTAVLYMKIVICMAISICTVPIVLHSLGESDYGLFNLIAGIISMLAFINGAMTVSTQRYLSVTIGEKDKNKLLQVYNISILLHIIIGLIIVLLIEGSIPILFKYFLNINSGQEDVAHLLFHFLVISMFFSVVTVPFDAVLNSYENMLFFSISGIIEYLLK